MALALSLSSAVLGTAAAQIMPRHKTLGEALAFGAALAAGTTPLFAGRAGPAAIRTWTRLRSMSEALKSEVYLCLAGVGAYRATDRLRQLTERVNQLRVEAADLLPHLAGDEPVPRSLPAVVDVDTYVEYRLERQISEYYRPKAAEMARKSRRVGRAQTLLGLAGTALGACSAVFGIEQAVAWVAVVAVAGVAVSAHARAAKYEYQQIEFSRTAEELERLRAGRNAAGSREADADDAFVAQCEQVISVLNDSWMVKWTTE